MPIHAVRLSLVTGFVFSTLSLAPAQAATEQFRGSPMDISKACMEQLRNEKTAVNFRTYMSDCIQGKNPTVAGAAHATPHATSRTTTTTVAPTTAIVSKPAAPLATTATGALTTSTATATPATPPSSMIEKTATSDSQKPARTKPVAP